MTASKKKVAKKKTKGTTGLKRIKGNLYQRYMGGPTLFSAKVLTETFKYLDECEDEYEAYITSEAITPASTKQSFVLKLKASLPTIEGLALHLKVSVQTLYNWKDKHIEFLEALDILMMRQKNQIILMGLSGAYSSTIAALMLSNNHNMNTQVGVDVKQDIQINLTPQDMLL